MNARPTGTRTSSDAERSRRQRARNWAIFLALAAFVLVVYVVTIVRMKGG